jgi:hypothetical protein
MNVPAELGSKDPSPFTQNQGGCFMALLDHDEEKIAK